MRRPSISLTILLLFWAVLGSGCGGADPPPPETAGDEGRSEVASQLEELGEQNEHLSSQVRELQGRLSLSRAEARDLRDAAAVRSQAPTREIVRIGAPDEAPAAALDDEDWDEPLEEASAFAQDEDDGSPRPLLRLYGSPAAAPLLDTSTPLVIPPAPPGVPVRLPYAALPEPERAFAAHAPRSVGPAGAGGADGAAFAAYQHALAHLRDRHFENALRAFDDFLRAHPRHPYAASAVYWQGEVYYAMRDYRHALSRFSRVVDEYPRATKVSDSLFKMGMCHQRMGRERAARRIFERVRRQFPESVAARLSRQEDA